MPIAVLYNRVSTVRQAEKGTSLDFQEKEGRKLATTAGETVLPESIFIDRGESAKTIDRTELRKMMQYVEAHKHEVSTVYFYDFSRFTRDSADFHVLRAFFKRLGVRCVSVTQPTDDTPEGRFFENMYVGMAQLDNELRALKSRNGMVSAVGEGRYISRPTLGFIRVRVLNKATVAPHEPYAGHIRHGFELVEHGYTQTEALAVLTGEGFTRLNGKSVCIKYWNKILHNPVYKGYIRAFAKEYGKPVKGTFEPIVSEELFDRVQAILARQNKCAPKYQKQRADFPLRRFATCPKGHRFTASLSKGRSGQRYPFYRCNICPKSNVAKAEIEKAFMTILEQSCMDEGLAVLLRIAIEENWKAAGTANEKRRQELEKQILSLKGEQEHFARKNFAQVLDDDTTRDLVAKTKKAITECEQELVLIPRTSDEIGHVVEYGINIMRNPRVAWEAFSLTHKLRFQSLLFPEGLPFADGQFGTAKKALILQTKTAHLVGESHLVTPRGVEPRLQA